MRKQYLLTGLLAASLVAPTAAVAHGGNDRGDRDSRSFRSAGAPHAFGESKHRGAPGRVKVNTHVKAARVISDDDNDRDDHPKVTVTPTASPSPTASPAAVRIVGQFHLRGTVGSVADGSVTVNGQTVAIDPKTKVVHGPLAAGQQVIVVGFLKSDGTFMAKVVIVKAGATSSPSPEPSATPSAEPTATPTPEPTAGVTATETPTASPTPSPTATPTAQFIGSFTLRGKITAVNGDGSIVVNGQTIMVTSDTKVKVHGGLTVGRYVNIQGGITTEGDLQARTVTPRHPAFFARFWNWYSHAWSWK